MTHAREIGMRLCVTPLCVHVFILIQKKQKKKEKQQRHQLDHEHVMQGDRKRYDWCYRSMIWQHYKQLLWCHRVLDFVYILSDPATSSYFPLTTACLFSHGKYVRVFLITPLILLILLKFWVLLQSYLVPLNSIRNVQRVEVKWCWRTLWSSFIFKLFLAKFLRF